jgi:rhodanese-related sulfurtransferase
MANRRGFGNHRPAQLLKLSAMTTMQPTRAEALPRISPRDAAAMLAAGTATLVDVREPDEHRREHVAGAALHPSSAFSVSGFPASVPGRQTLILCRSGNRAGKVADALRAAGRTDVSVVEGGIMAWQKAGLPCEANPKAPLPLVRQVMITVGILLMAFTALAATVSPWFLIGTGFMGAGLLFAGATGICALATVLSKMPWNRATGPASPAKKPTSCAGGSCCS